MTETSSNRRESIKFVGFNKRIYHVAKGEAKKQSKNTTTKEYVRW